MDTTATTETEQLALFKGGIDIGKLRALGERLHTGPACAPLTAQGYARDWSLFLRWCLQAGRTPLPASGDTIWLYATSMIERGCKSFTAHRHLSSILHHHRAAGLREPDTQRVRGLIAAVRRDRKERYEGKRALTPQDLARCSKACDASTFMGARDRAMLVLGFATSLRRSELVGLDLSDLVFEGEGLAVFVRKAKNDQSGKGRFIAVWPGSNPDTNPVAIVRHWITHRGAWAGPLFARTDGHGNVVHDRLLGQAVNIAVKRAMERAGLDAKLYGAHSLRAGAVTAAAQQGRSDQEIMALSGHKSAAVMTQYVRRARVFDGRNPLAGVL